MGIGDSIMSTAEAKRINEATGRKVAFSNGFKVFFDEQVFKKNPRIVRELGPDVEIIPDFPGHRPYIKRYEPGRFVFDENFKATPGELFIDCVQKGDYILIEPNVKTDLMIGPNKDWGFEKWQELVNQLDLPFVQPGVMGKPSLVGVRRADTRTFREALGLLASAKLLVTTDGALHHAAAALGVPAVVIWGGLASPKNLGYDMHKNIWHGVEPCGTHSKRCDHCRQALASVTVKEVKAAVLKAYEGR